MAEPVDPTPPDRDVPQPSPDQDNAVEDLHGFRYDGTTLEIDLGFANVAGVSIDLAFDDLSVMGFAPVLFLRHRKTQSNIHHDHGREFGDFFGV